MLFILLFFFDMVNFIYVMSICVCVNRTIDGDLQVVLHGSSFWDSWKQFLGKLASLYLV